MVICDSTKLIDFSKNGKPTESAWTGPSVDVEYLEAKGYFRWACVVLLAVVLVDHPLYYLGLFYFGRMRPFGRRTPN